MAKSSLESSVATDESLITKSSVVTDELQVADNKIDIHHSICIPNAVEFPVYFFIDRANFEDMIKKNQLLEYAEYVGNYYGTPRRYVENQLSMGKNVILEIEMQGAMKIKRNMPDTKIINIFVSTVDAVTLYGRLVGRGTESIDVIKKRMDRAVEESGIMEEYDYLIINDDLETATTQLHDIILNERNGQAELNEAARIASNKEFINDMKIKLLSFSKGELQ